MDVNHDCSRLERTFLYTRLCFSSELIPVEGRNKNTVTHGQEFTISMFNMLYIGELMEVYVE